MFRQETSEASGESWVVFPGGELEGRPPRMMCPACRARAGRQGTLCFQCYRVGLDRERRLKAAAVFDGASEARFQGALPFEPVDRGRLNRLRIERSVARTAALQSATGQFKQRIRRAQIEARKAVQGSQALRGESSASRGSVDFYAALHAAELQLPESWMPFVASR